MEALPRVIATLTRFEPAVLLTADGRGALYAPASDGDDPIRRFWLLADARTALEWEGARRHELTLTFQSRDERVYLQITGLAQVVTEPGVAGTALAPQLPALVPRWSGRSAAAAGALHGLIGRVLRERIGTRQRAALTIPF